MARSSTGISFVLVTKEIERSEAVTFDAVTPTAELDRWCRFHEAVEVLPTEEREVVVAELRQQPTSTPRIQSRYIHELYRITLAP